VPSSVPSAALQILVGEAVESVLQALWEGGVLVPTVFCVSRESEQAAITPKATNVRSFGDSTSIDTDLAQSLVGARRYVDLLSPSLELRYVWAFDGSVGPQRTESVIIEAAEAGEPHGWRLAVRYRLSKRGIALLDDTAVVIGAVDVPFCQGD
jgi:hypothetical protein